MAGAEVVVDVSNAPAWGDKKVLEFFTTVTRNALKAGRRAGARHRVALSVLGCGRLPESGYMRAKVAEEKVIREARVPFTIVHSMQFIEFLVRVADAGTEAGVVRAPDTRVQPIAAVEAPGWPPPWRRRRQRIASSRSPVPSYSRSRTRSPACWLRRATAAWSSLTRPRGTSGLRSATASSCPARGARLADLRLADSLSRRGDQAAAA